MDGELNLVHAHVYDSNLEKARVVAARMPMDRPTRPMLVVSDEAGGLFDIAQDFEDGPSMLSVCDYHAHEPVNFKVASS